MDGFLSAWERGHWKFVAPCTFYSSGTSMQVRYASPLHLPMQVKPLLANPQSHSNFNRTELFIGLADKRAAGKEEGASVHARGLLRPGGSWPEQADLGVPEELCGLARHDHTTVVLPHQPEQRSGFRCLHPPCRGDSTKKSECFCASLTHYLSSGSELVENLTFPRSANLLHQASITGRTFATCRHRRTPWSSPSGTGSGSTARTGSAGQPHSPTSCRRPLPRTQSWRGKIRS